MNDTTTVLYDAPGPRARIRTAAASAFALVLILAFGYWYVYRPLAARGQFSGELWGPLVNPDNEYFGQVWRRIGAGFRATLSAAAVAIVTSLLVGTALAVFRVQTKALTRRRFVGTPRAVAVVLRVASTALAAITRCCVEVFRGIPVVITIFFVWVWLPTIGARSATPGQTGRNSPFAFENPIWYLVIGLTIYNSVVIGEVLRSGMEGLPDGQREAAGSIGLTPFQTTRLILLPQAYRIMLPALISQLVVVLKDTSLGFIISYEEVLRVSSQVVQILNNPIQVYAVVGAIYIVINYLVTKLAQFIERRLAQGRRAAVRGDDARQPILAEEGAT